MLIKVVFSNTIQENVTDVVVTLKLRAKRALKKTIFTHRCCLCNSSTDDSGVKEQKACHQRHCNLCDPSSGQALLRDEPRLRGVHLVPCVRGDKG